MHTLLKTQPDIQCSISPVTAMASDGKTIAVVEELAISDETVLGFVWAENSGPTNPRRFQLRVLRAGLVSIEYTAKDNRGQILKAAGAQFNVPETENISVIGGNLVVDGFTTDARERGRAMS